MGHFLKAQVLLRTNKVGYKNIKALDTKLISGNIVDFRQAINITIGTNFSTTGIFNIIGSIIVQRIKYNNTLKQVLAFISDLLYNRRSRPYILYNVKKKTI